jgi:hypothetical protein
MMTTDLPPIDNGVDFYLEDGTSTLPSLTTGEAVKALEALVGKNDTEKVHREADVILLRAVPREVFDAYARLLDRSEGFWYS